jgi:hypothetical protein
MTEREGWSPIPDGDGKIAKLFFTVYTERGRLSND